MKPLTLAMVVVAAALVLALMMVGGATLRSSRSPSHALAPASMELDEEKAVEAPKGAARLLVRSAPKREAPADKRKRRAAESVADGDFGALGLVGEGFGGGGVGGLAAALQNEPEAPAPSAATPTARAWFPETFLFEPLVKTDETGKAQVPLRIPDRLTRWRVLGLAHARNGGLAGAVSTFQGTLPAYVDPVVPPFLIAGDQVRLPVQAVNTTDRELASQLRLTAVGGTLVGGGALRVPAEGAVVQYATLTAAQPGKVVVKAALGDADAIERSVEVQPAGRPVVKTVGGTLAAPRTLKLTGEKDALVGSERVRLAVFPGALAILRAELGTVIHRGGVAEDAYALLLAGKATALLTSLGDAADPDAIQLLSKVASQRALRHARAPDAATASVLAEAALAHPGNPVLARLGERLADGIAAAQRPDGTCGGGDGWTLQRVLLATADCVQAVGAADQTPAGKQRRSRVLVRAAGAVERNLGRIDDGYTAAALVASGAAQGAMAEQLRAKVLAALRELPDGTQALEVAPGVVRGDGRAPSQVEATALAVLALQGEPKAPMADLGSALLAGYTPYSGWGDGRANLVCLRAALLLFRDKVSSNVTVSLLRDGKPVVDGTLDSAKLREVLTLEGPAAGSGGEHEWKVRAEPPVPGLGFSLQLLAHVPWKATPAEGGLELKVTAPTQLKVGEPATVQLAASAPADTRLRIRHALPAGFQPDARTLDELVSSGAITEYKTEDGQVTLEVPQRPAGQPFVATYQVVPTLGGTLHAKASSIEAVDRDAAVHFVPSATVSVR